MDEIPGETIGTVIAADAGETVSEEETEGEEDEEVEEPGEIMRSDRGDFRVENFLRNSYSPVNEVPWDSEGFQPYGSNLPREENPSDETPPMPPSFTSVPRTAEQEDTPVREVRTVEDTEREFAAQRLPTPTPNPTASTEPGLAQVAGGSWRTYIFDSETEWEGELQRRWRQYCEEEDPAAQYQEEEEEEDPSEEEPNEEDPVEAEPSEEEAQLRSHELIHVETEDDEPEPAIAQYLNRCPEYSGGRMTRSSTPSPIRSITAEIPDRHLHHFTSYEDEAAIRSSAQHVDNPTPKEVAKQNRKRRMTVKEYLKGLMGRKKQRGSSSRNPGDAP